MHKILPSKFVMALFMGMSFLFISCGKKPETKSSQPERHVPPVITNDYIDKQNVACEGNQACPQYITKIVVVQGSEAKFCTGFLTDDNTVATSTSCLPEILRLEGQDCSKSVFFFFPGSSYRSSERAGCTEVLQASQLMGKDPVLWRDDISFLSLSKSMRHRRKPEIERDGVSDGKEYVVWSVDQQDDYTGIIKKFKCEAVHNNYINPLIENVSSPNMIFAGCNLPAASNGSPVVVNFRRKASVRAVISQSMDSNLRTYIETTGLLTGKLKSMFHATNFACASTPDNYEMLDEMECLKDLTEVKVDRMRSLMLSSEILFSELRKSFEESLSKISDHVQFGAKFVTQNDVQKAVIFPKCFKPLNHWLRNYRNRNTLVSEVLFPDVSFKKVMNSLGRLEGSMINSPGREMSVQYSLKNLRSSARSSVLIWSSDQELEVFSGLTEECSLF